MFERKLIRGNPTTWGAREFGPSGVIVMTSGSPSSRNDIFNYLNLPTQLGSVHALVDATGITQVWPFNRPALGDLPDEFDDALKILVCEPAGKNFSETQELTTKTLQNLALSIVFLCRYHQIDPDASLIRFVGLASENGIDLPECKRSTHRCHAAHSSPLFERSQYACETSDGYAEDLVKAEVLRLRVETTKLIEENTATGVERPVDAIGVDDVVLFMGGPLYKSRSASAVSTSTALPQLGVVRRVYLQSKHCYEVAFPSGIWYVNKSSVRKSPLGHVVL